MRRARAQLAFLGLIVVAGAGMIIAYIVVRGVSARDEPSPVESFIARRLRRLAIPRDARNLSNPVQFSPEVLSRAKAHFADHCASCHGNDGRGETLIGRGLYPKPPNMAEANTQQLTDGELYYIIENGIRFTGMPAFGEEAGNAKDLESWDLAHFIRHLPSITDEELIEMKTMNPKSPAEQEQEERIRKFLEGDDSAPLESTHEHHH